MECVMIPFGAFGYLEGSYIKINEREQVFYYHDGEWLLSTKNAKVVRAQLGVKKHKFDKGE